MVSACGMWIKTHFNNNSLKKKTYTSLQFYSNKCSRQNIKIQFGENEIEMVKILKNMAQYI